MNEAPNETPIETPKTHGKVWTALHFFFSDLPAWLMIVAVRGYQYTLSPIFGRQCRFYPTCSHYFIGAVKKYGPWRGAWRGACRICRCHPFHPGGYDPP
jgi:putative membrane protein insertion efficiency factor